MKGRTISLGVAGALLALLLFACGPKKPTQDTFDWPGWRGPNGDGISQEADWNPEAMSSGAKILWRANIGRGHSNVAIVNNRLYTMGYIERVNHVLCLDADTGREIWRTSVGTGFYEPNSTPTVDNGSVYAIATEGELICLKAKNGKIRWQKDLTYDFDSLATYRGWSSSPRVEGDLLLINANTKALGLDKKTGDLIWSFEDQKPKGSWGSYASPVLYDNNGTRCVAFLGPGRLFTVELASGKELWSFTHNERLHAIPDPIVSESKIFVSLHDTCYVLEPDGPKPRILWESQELISDIATAVLVDGFLYGTHWTDRYVTTNDWNTMRRFDWPLRCVDFETGAVAWEQNMEYTAPIAADGKLILLGIKGTLRIAEASPSGYTEMSRGDVSGGKKNVVFAVPPVLCNGKIYCRDFWGDLICVDMGE